MMRGGIAPPIVMLSEAKHLYTIALDSNLPTTARNVYVRAVRHNIDEALWGIDIYKRSAHLKSVLGGWGSKRDKGNASQVVPLVPLEENSHAKNLRKYGNKIESKQLGI